MAVQSFTPSNDVEFNIFTTEPAWATENIETGENWDTLKFLKRDLRLGNLNPKLYDTEWLENMVQLTQNLLSLRNGIFIGLAPMCLIKVVAPVELSHSHSGFFRRWARSYSFSNSDSEESKTGMWGKMFK